MIRSVAAIRSAAGRIAWDYVSPFVGASPPPPPPGHAQPTANWTYFAQAVPAAWRP